MPMPVAAVGEGRQQLGVLLAALEQVVAGDQPVGRAGQAPIAVEAGLDERLVGQVVAAEHRGHALVERGLRQRAGGRQEAEDGPLDAVGERRCRGVAILAIGQPPAAGLDLGQAALVRRGRARRGSRRGAARRDRRRRRHRARSTATGSIVGGLGGSTAAGVGGRPAAGGRRRASAGSAGAWSGAGAPAVVRRRRRARAGREPSELAGPVQADEDLAEQPLHAGGLAAGAERLDRRLGHDLARPRPPRTVAGRTAPGGANSPRPGTMSGSPEPPGTAGSPTLARVRGPGGRAAPGRHELDDARAGIVRVRQPRDRDAVPGRRATDRHRGQRLHAAVDELDDAAVARHRRLDGRQRPADRHGLPATTGRAATCRPARRWAAAPPPRGPGSTPSRGTPRPAGRGWAGSAAGRGRAGPAASARRTRS